MKWLKERIDETVVPDVGEEADKDGVGLDEADLDVDVVDMEGGALNNDGGGDDVCAVVIGVVWMAAILFSLRMT